MGVEGDKQINRDHQYFISKIYTYDKESQEELWVYNLGNNLTKRIQNALAIVI